MSVAVRGEEQTAEAEERGRDREGENWLPIGEERRKHARGNQDLQ